MLSQGFNDRKPGQIFAQQIPLHQLQPEKHLSHPMHPYQPQSVQEFPLTQPSDTRSQQQQAPIGQYSSPQMTGQIYNQGPMPHHPQAQQVVTTMQQPVLAMQQHQIPIQPIRQQETQPNQQPTMMQASQPLQRQMLPVESQMEQGTGKEASQQVRSDEIEKYINSYLSFNIFMSK